MINPGTYKAIARSVQFGTTNSGTDQCAVELEILGDGPDAGSSITWFGFFSDKATARTMESLKLMGWDGVDLAELPALVDAGKLSTQVQIVVEHETYQGKVSAKVKWVNRIGGRAKISNPIEGKDLRAFADRMKARVSGEPPPEPKPIGPNDDIPFASADAAHEPDPRTAWRRPV